ncbi:MAG: hypothetical protein RR365_01145 [Bacteroides sp.]
MPKPIYLTDELVEDTIAEFKKSLSSAQMLDGKFSFIKSFAYKTGAKAKLYYSATAYTQQLALLNNFDSEVAWHGIIKRLPKEENAYLVERVVVYPQIVGAATVEMDDAKYGEWVSQFSDEDFFNIRFQCHSHVNMGCTPSTVDLDHQQKILEQVSSSDLNKFYVFSIWNKKMEHVTRIYDFENNIYFDNSEIEIDLYDADCDMSDFIELAKKTAVKRTFTAVPSKDTKFDRWPYEKTTGSGYCSPIDGRPTGYGGSKQDYAYSGKNWQDLLDEQYSDLTAFR